MTNSSPSDRPQMAEEPKAEQNEANDIPVPSESPSKTTKPRSRARDDETASAKRRCVSTACIACRRRKSKCDGNTPSCAACASVYGTECVYDPTSDHRRKGVYKKDIDNLKTRNSTLQTLIQAILNYPESEVPDLVKQIRTCESLDDVAEGILLKDAATGDDEDVIGSPHSQTGPPRNGPNFESALSGRMGELRLENGSVQFIGGTSNLLSLGSGVDTTDTTPPLNRGVQMPKQQLTPVTSWTTVTDDTELILHLLNMYFAWHYAYFTILSKTLFYQNLIYGSPSQGTTRENEFCTPLLLNAILSLGCHFTSWPAARADPSDSATAGDHFFKEAKRLILENDEHENPRLATVQALALMSVREAGCGREAKGWVYSGMSFRMAFDLGLNVDSANLSFGEQEMDARRMTIWGCFLIDKCWSNYLGRQPQLPQSSITSPKFEVFPVEDAELWTPYYDNPVDQLHAQPSRTRAIALQTSTLCEISSDLLMYFYHPTHLEKSVGKQAELKKLSELQTRLEAWRKDLPKEMEAKEGQLPNVLVMHMFFHLLFIHLFRPFLKYNQVTSPLPAHVSPRKVCSQAASMISKLLRLYKRTHGLRQICNIAVYIAHSACTIHLLNLPEKNARRDLFHGVKHLEEIAESWLCARRTLCILSMLIRKWKIELPQEVAVLLARTETRYQSTVEKYPSAATSIATSPSITYSPTSSSGNNRSDLVFALPTQKPLNAAAMMTPALTPETHPPQEVKSVPPHQPSSSSSELNSQIPRKPRHVIPQAQQELWNKDRASRGSVSQPQSSPTTLFGGIDSLFDENQDWWLRDQSALAHGFENWNAVEADAAAAAANATATATANAMYNSQAAGNTGGNGNGAYSGFGRGGVTTTATPTMTNGMHSGSGNNGSISVDTNNNSIPLPGQSIYHDFGANGFVYNNGGGY